MYSRRIGGVHQVALSRLTATLDHTTYTDADVHVCSSPDNGSSAVPRVELCALI